MSLDKISAFKDYIDLYPSNQYLMQLIGTYAEKNKSKIQFEIRNY